MPNTSPYRAQAWRGREIAGQRRAHRHHESDAIPVDKPQHERLEHQDCGNVADDVREHGSFDDENIGIVEMEVPDVPAAMVPCLGYEGRC